MTNQPYKTKIISSAQVFALLIVARLGAIVSETFGGCGVNVATLWQTLVAAAVLVVLLFPAVLFKRAFPDENIMHIAQRKAGKWLAYILCVMFAVLFIWSGAAQLSRFLGFIQAEVEPRLTVWIVVAVLLLCGIYMACRGTEAVARAAGVLAVLMLLGLLFLILTSVQHVQGLQVANGGGNFWFRQLQANVTVAAVYLILPQVKGNIGASMASYIVFGTIATATMAWLIMSSFGNFASTLEYPLFTLVSLRTDIMFLRPDIVAGTMALTGTLIQLSVSLLAIMIAIRSLWERASKGIIIWSAASVMGLFLFLK